MANETLFGTTGADTLAGGTGDNIYYVDNAKDLIVESSNGGIDTVYSSVPYYTVSSYIENIILTGTGDLRLVSNYQDNLIYCNSGNNFVNANPGNDTIYGYAGNDTLFACYGNDLVYGGIGNDSLVGAPGDDTLYGEAGVDTLDGRGENDTYVIDDNYDLVKESVGKGTDTVMASVNYSLTANVENLVLTGTNAVNGTGNELDNVITGNSAANVLSGLAGNDTYIINVNSGQDTIMDAAGSDILKFGTGITKTDLTFTQSGDDLIIARNGAIDKITIQNWYTSDSYKIERLEFADGNYITSSDVNTRIVGNDTLPSGNDTLPSGNDTLPSGNDTLPSGNDTLPAGNDTLPSGNDTLPSGNDTLPSGNDTLPAGNDTLPSGNDTLPAGNDTLPSGNDTLPSGNDTLPSGNDTLPADNNTLIGTSGDDTINGTTGIDTMAGGLGNDTYYVDNKTDMIIENADEGNDTIMASVAYSISPNVENITLTGTANITTIGNYSNNVITGNSGNDFVNANPGNDTIYGYAGNDTLFACYGNDLVYGGIGNDSLVGAPGDDTLYGEAGVDTLDGRGENDTYVIDDIYDLVIESSGKGTDTVLASVNYSLTANVENLVLTGTNAVNGTGNELDNVITGNSAANVLSGLSGNDTYVINANSGQDTIADSAGTDILQFGSDIAKTDLAFTKNGNDLIIAKATSTDKITIQNWYTDDSYKIEKLVFSDGTYMSSTDIITNPVENDTVPPAGVSLLGTSGNDKLTGTAGNDTLNGNPGIDTMIGGLGNDIYYAGSAADVVIENTNEGIDTVMTGTTFTLPNNVENLTMVTGTSGWAGTGNALDNVIIGNSGKNALYGLAGNDTLDGGLNNDTLKGGAGNDTYYIDVKTDVIAENTNEGTDTVIAGFTYTLGNNLENLTLSGTAAINGAGNTLNNTLIGNSAVNTLSGLAGNDTYIFETGSKKDIVKDSAGTDKISFGSSVSQSKVAFFLSGSTLYIDHGNTANLDQITVTSQGNGTLSTSIDRFELSNGKYLASAEVNSVISYITSYDKSHTELTITSVNDVKNNADLMTYISNQWHT